MWSDVHVMFNNDRSVSLFVGVMNDKDALRWCVANRISAKPEDVLQAISDFSLSEMGWDSECRYKMLGFLGLP